MSMNFQLISIFAFLFMLLDHITKAFQLEFTTFSFLLGRLAFPLFLLSFALTFHKRKDKKKIFHLILLAFISQPFYSYIFSLPFYDFNILFLFTSLLVAENYLSLPLKVIFLLIASIPLSFSSYGIFGILAFYFIRFFSNSLPLAFFFSLFFPLLSHMHFSFLLFYSILFLFPLGYFILLLSFEIKYRLNLPPFSFLYFLHLFFLAIIKFFF